MVNQEAKHNRKMGVTLFSDEPDNVDEFKGIDFWYDKARRYL